VETRDDGAIEQIYTAARPVLPRRGCLHCAGLIDPMQFQREAATPEERDNQNYLGTVDVIDPSARRPTRPPPPERSRVLDGHDGTRRRRHSPIIASRTGMCGDWAARVVLSPTPPSAVVRARAARSASGYTKGR
jgi:hypothetical protein